MDLLAAVPSEGRTLADIARHLAVDKATCYPMLSELTRLGWLVRHPRRKTFHLGPSLVTLGRAAARALDLVDIARPRMQRLADDLAIAATLSMPSGDELVIADVVHPAGRRTRTYQLRAGDRIVFRPPHGAALLAWAAPAIVERWIRRRAADASPAETEALHEALATIRARGFSVQEHRSPHEIRDQSPLPTAGGSLRARSIDLRIDDWMRDKQLVNDLHAHEAVWPISVSAPIFDADAHAVALVSTLQQPRPTTPEAVEHIARQVLDATTDITDTIHGRIPQT
jgi:DNA-binding IclR family transcriptional regulator